MPLLLWKSILLPIAGIVLSSYIFPLNPQTLAAVVLMLATPLAGNVVAIFSQWRTCRKAAVAVMLCTLQALTSMPFIVRMTSYAMTPLSDRNHSLARKYHEKYYYTHSRMLLLASIL
jgi:hypothetical protein